MLNPPMLAEQPAILARLPNQSFDRIRRMVFEKAGIDLREGKKELVSARLSKKVLEAGCSNYEQYLDRVCADRTGDLLTALIDALTTNFTSFFRESAHFDFLREQVLPRLAGRRQVSLWCAAAATGEEAYSLIFTMLETLEPRRCRLLATDLSIGALTAARKGIYAEERLANIPLEWLSRYFLRGSGDFAGLYQVKRDIASLVEFAQLNLIEPLPRGEQFPVIFCRNVMIYFDRATQERVVNRLAQCLEPGGYLMVGHAESLNGMRHPLRFVQPAVYQLAECIHK